MVVQPNKAIVGRECLCARSRHPPGRHVEERADLRDHDAGNASGWTSTNLVLGKHSGRAALNDRLKQMGYDLSREELDKAFERFKALCDKKKVVSR